MNAMILALLLAGQDLRTEVSAVDVVAPAPVQWVVLDSFGALVPVEGGARDRLTLSKPGKYRVIAAGAGKPLETSVTVGGTPSPNPQPPSPPGPGPNPPPGPSPPGPPGPGPAPTPEPPKPPEPGKFGLQRWAFDRASGLDPPAKAKSAAVAKAIREVAPTITFADALSGAMSDKVHNAVRKASGDQADRWQVLSNESQKEIERLYSERKIRTLPDLKAALVELAVGLEAVR